MIQQVLTNDNDDNEQTNEFVYDVYYLDSETGIEKLNKCWFEKEYLI